MYAAVLHRFGQAPRYEMFPDPPVREGEGLVRVRAAALKQIDRLMASGGHYASQRTLPAIGGVDGVVELSDGGRVYCGGARPPYGLFAELAAVPHGWGMPVPDALDDATAAALPNAALSSWLALTERAQLRAGERVLIMGATGGSGRLAVQIAKHLGAGWVGAAGRNAASLAALPDLGADALIPLGGTEEETRAALAEAARGAGIDIVLDFLWGRPTELLLDALTGHDLAAEPHRTRLIAIGEMAGSTVALPGSALRSSGVEILGSGGGSASIAAIMATIPKVFALAAGGQLRIPTETAPLADVEALWARGERDGRRLVFVP